MNQSKPNRALPIFLLHALFAVTWMTMLAASFVWASELWTWLVWTFCTGALLLAVVLACAATDSLRMFFLGFAVCGWGHHFAQRTMYPVDERGGPAVSSTKWLVWSYDNLVNSGIERRNFDVDERLERYHFVAAGHSITALLWAWLGAFVGPVAYWLLRPSASRTAASNSAARSSPPQTRDSTG